VNKSRRLLTAGAALTMVLCSMVGSGSALASRTSALSGTIRFYTWDNKTMFPFLDTIFGNLHKSYPGITVKVEPSASITQLKMITQIATGTAADVIQVGDIDLPWFVSKTAFAPLDPYMQSDKITKDLWAPAAFNLGVVNGHTYALTKDFATLAVFYNKDLFDKAHLAYPKAGWTWDDMVKDAKALTVSKNGRRVQWGISLPGAWARGVEPMVRDFGGNLVSPDGKKIQGYMNSPQTIAATQFYMDIVNKHHAGLSLAEAATLSNLDVFASGKVGMNWTGPWSITTWQQSKNFHFGVAPMPSYNGKNYSNICWAGFAMNAKTKNPAAAWQVIKALSGPDGSSVFAKWGLPAVKSVAARMQAIDPLSYPYRLVFLNQNSKVPAVPGDMRNPDGHASVETPYEDAIKHLAAHPEVSVKSALDAAAAKGQKELDSYMSNQ